MPPDLVDRANHSTPVDPTADKSYFLAWHAVVYCALDSAVVSICALSARRAARFCVTNIAQQRELPNKRAAAMVAARGVINIWTRSQHEFDVDPDKSRGILRAGSEVDIILRHERTRGVDSALLILPLCPILPLPVGVRTVAVTLGSGSGSGPVALRAVVRAIPKVRVLSSAPFAAPYTDCSAHMYVRPGSHVARWPRLVRLLSGARPRRPLLCVARRLVFS